MALILCNECGKEVSDKAESCPHCGAPVTAKEEEYSEIKTCLVCGEYFGKGKMCVSCGADRDDQYILQFDFLTGHLSRMRQVFRDLFDEKMETCSNRSEEDVSVFDECLVKIITIISLHSHKKKYMEYFKENDCKENHKYMNYDTYKQIINQEVNIIELIDEFDVALDECVTKHTEKWCANIVKPLKPANRNRSESDYIYGHGIHSIYPVFWKATVVLFDSRQRYLKYFRNKDYEKMEAEKETILSEVLYLQIKLYNAIGIMEMSLIEIAEKYNLV